MFEIGCRSGWFTAAVAGWPGVLEGGWLRCQCGRFGASARPTEAAHGYGHDDRWHGDLLQGLGLGPADCLQPRLAAVGRRLGHPDAVLPPARLPRRRS